MRPMAATAIALIVFGICSIALGAYLESEAIYSFDSNNPSGSTSTTPDPYHEEVPFSANSGNDFGFQIILLADQTITIRLEFGTSIFDSLTLNGPGDCSAKTIGSGIFPQSASVEFQCGIVESGNYNVRIQVGSGMAQGTMVIG